MRAARSSATVSKLNAPPEAWPRAREASEHAVALAPELAEAHKCARDHCLRPGLGLGDDGPRVSALPRA